MTFVLKRLLSQMEDEALHSSGVIPWSSPILAFGNRTAARVATLGLNPSNREFVDDMGCELPEDERRFHTLRSLGLRTWTSAATRHFRLLEDSYRNYFASNPYDRWFRRLDYIITGTGASFYDSTMHACHLDLVPFATSTKWGGLRASQRDTLLNVTGSALAALLRESSVELLIMNGSSVVREFSRLAPLTLTTRTIPSWSLPRRTGTPVRGVAYTGQVDRICGISLGRKIDVLGYNHNIQSSFGVTKGVMASIRRWITASSRRRHEC